MGLQLLVQLEEEGTLEGFVRFLFREEVIREEGCRQITLRELFEGRKQSSDEEIEYQKEAKLWRGEEEKLSRGITALKGGELKGVALSTEEGEGESSEDERNPWLEFYRIEERTMIGLRIKGASLEPGARSGGLKLKSDGDPNIQGSKRGGKEFKGECKSDTGREEFLEGSVKSGSFMLAGGLSSIGTGGGSEVATSDMRGGDQKVAEEKSEASGGGDSQDKESSSFGNELDLEELF